MKLMRQLLFIALLAIASSVRAQSPLTSTTPANNQDYPLNYLPQASNANGPAADNLDSTITAARTYFVCTKANGSTCVSTDAGNSWNGNATVSTTIADSNDCLTKATPCRTVGGVEGKIHAKRMSAIVTVYVADNANTGTDCLTDGNLAFVNRTSGVQLVDRGRLDTFPPSYIYLYGNPTTPANVSWVPGGSCGSATVGTTDSAVIADGPMTVRVNGFQFEGNGTLINKGFAPGAVQAGTQGHVYGENLIGIGNMQTQSGAAAFLVAAHGAGSEADIGQAITVTHGMQVLGSYNGGTAHTYDPSDTATNFTTISYTCATSEVCNFASMSALMSGSWSNLFVDRMNFTAAGAGTMYIEGAQLRSQIIYSEVYTGSGDCNMAAGAGKCKNFTMSAGMTAANYSFEKSNEGSYIDSDADSGTDSSCTVTVQPTIKGIAIVGGQLRDFSGSCFTSPSYTINSGGAVHTFGGANDTTIQSADTIQLGNATNLTFQASAVIGFQSSSTAGQNVRLGPPSAAPQGSQTINAENCVAGTTNCSGSGLQLNPGNATGNATVNPTFIGGYVATGTSGTTTDTFVNRAGLGGQTVSITNNTATTVFHFAIPTNQNVGIGTFAWGVKVTGTSNSVQATSGIVTVSAVNSNGTVTCNVTIVGTPTATLSTGTDTVAFATSVSSTTCNVQLTSNSSLTTPVTTFTWSGLFSGDVGGVNQ